MGKVSENLKTLRGYIGSRQIETSGPGKVKYIGYIKVFFLDNDGQMFVAPIRGYKIKVGECECILPVGELEIHPAEHFREMLELLKTNA